MIEVYNREGVLETTLRPALTRTTRKIVVQAKVSRSPCYLHVNPQLAAVLTLGESVWKRRDNAERIVAWPIEKEPARVSVCWGLSSSGSQ